ncbi:hypothetical protein IE53DRAFT_244332 [Violaceomyces palustris]|uniref:Uncharacterized protein n=1 Tax=Violaceomyces palustris TaxID=1673888 RepID=A0ACD0NP19_9BASI|nr:hypothetical protein IE53DRAFT_244332 [Violaceomyces palustris]
MRLILQCSRSLLEKQASTRGMKFTFHRENLAVIRIRPSRSPLCRLSKAASVTCNMFLLILAIQFTTFLAPSESCHHQASPNPPHTKGSGGLWKPRFFSITFFDRRITNPSDPYSFFTDHPHPFPWTSFLPNLALLSGT